MLAMSVEALMALSLEQLTDTLAIRVEGAKAWDKAFTIDVMVTDDKNGYHMNLSNGALTGHAIDFIEEPEVSTLPDKLTIWPTRAEFVELVSGARTTDG
jgi:alkyl sulfatase BDS1-like metallo-beta-lactamase superfamily hydrolase